MSGSVYNRINMTDESSLLCGYSGHLCGREKLSGHNFCLRHILEPDRGVIHSSQPINKPANPAIVIAQQLFKQCNYTISHRQTVLGSNGVPTTITGHRRCTRPAPKSDRKDGFCTEHSRRALMARQKTGRKRSSDPVLNSLEDLSHYKVLAGSGDGDMALAIPSARNQSMGTSIVGHPSKLPKLDVNGFGSTAESTNQTKVDTLDLMMKRIPYINARAFDSSELEGDCDGGDSSDPMNVESARWRPADDGLGNYADPEELSDSESLDSEIDNPLKYAGAYSAEEVIRLMREKLIRLQKLYIDQFQRLRYLLKDEARKFNIRLVLERDILDLGSIWMNSLVDKQGSVNGKDMGKKDGQASLEHISLYEKLKSLSHYQSPKGLEAVLYHQQIERRLKLGESGAGQSTLNTSNVGGGSTTSHMATHSSVSTSSAGAAASTIGIGNSYKQTILPKCSYHLTSSTKCGEPVIPLTKFCIKHILEDTTQVLFRICGHVPINSAVKNERREEESCAIECPVTEDFEGNVEKCETPIADVFEGATCIYHTQFQPLFSAFDEKIHSETPINVKKELDIE